MDFKPIPPDGKVHDLRNAGKVKTEEEIQQEKQARNDKVRRNLRLFALVLAAYYFASAGYSWYQESRHEQSAVTEVSAANPLRDPVAFRTTFNNLINQADTSLPTANANDTPEGFVAVLSTAVEIQGYSKKDSKELQSVQIQTRYPDAFPPESLIAFQTFILACEKMASDSADINLANEILNGFGIIPEHDANEDNKVFPQATIRSQFYEYRTSFTPGPIDELTLVVTPLVNLSTGTNSDTSNSLTITAADSDLSDAVAPADTATAAVGADAAAAADNDDAADVADVPVITNNSDVPQL